MTIELRHYQKNQIDFIERKSRTKLGVAIKSPTGSGKSYTLLEYTRRLIEKNKDKNFTVVIATGFNNLVYQLAKDCHKFGINPIVWVGQQHIVSESKLRDSLGMGPEDALSIDNHQAFTEDENLRASPKERCVSRKCKVNEKSGRLCLYHQAKLGMKEFKPKVIITNHTSYLIGLKYNMFNPDVAIIDESHTFSSYYESFNSMNLSPSEIKYIQGKLDESDPTLMLFKKSIEKGMKASPKILDLVMKKLSLEKGQKAYQIMTKLSELSDFEPSIDKFLEVSKYTGVTITNFWSSFDIMQDSIEYVLFSATQDKFTLNMFKIPKQNLYVEYDCNTIDYSQSNLLVYKNEEYSEAADLFLKRMDSEGFRKGLMLSTTNKDVRYLASLGELHGFKIFQNREKFQEYPEKSILIGSRALFQGVDISGLDFVSLNRIPFPSYDDKFKAMTNYLEAVAGINSWTGYTIPKVDNDITQSLGRLWRSPGDKGCVAIFDKRLDGKFSYFIKSIERERPGIKIEIVE